MYRFANIVLLVLAIFMVMGCSCSKTLRERNIQDEILNVDKLRKQSRKEYSYIEDDTEKLFVNSVAIYPDTLYHQQYTLLKDYFYGETGFDLYCTWYAQFNANNRKLYRSERKTLNKIFYCVNDMLRCIAGVELASHMKHTAYLHTQSITSINIRIWKLIKSPKIMT